MRDSDQTNNLSWEPCRRKNISTQLKGQEKDLAILGMALQANTNQSLEHDSGKHVSSRVTEGGQVLCFHDGVMIQWPTVNTDDTRSFPF